MGLDMSIYGDVESDELVEIAYWRKHPNLHGFIVNTFANGVDECQRIDLDTTKIDQILQAVRENNLPHTEGFFFGRSDSSDDPETMKLLYEVKAWMDNNPDGKVFYQASW